MASLNSFFIFFTGFNVSDFQMDSVQIIFFSKHFLPEGLYRIKKGITFALPNRRKRDWKDRLLGMLDLGGKK